MFENKKTIERIKNRVYQLEEGNLNLTTKLECVEKNTKALFEEFFASTNNLVCPVCGDKVYLVIDDRYQADVIASVMDLFKDTHIQDNGAFVYKIKCKNHCVGVRDESIPGAIEKFKSLKDEKEV